MDWLLYIPVLLLVRVLQSLPLRVVARIGRHGGGLAYWIDARHRRVALRNLEMWLGSEYSRDKLRAIAKENFRRRGENYPHAIKPAAMTAQQIKSHLQFAGLDKLYPKKFGASAPRRVVAIGH